MSSTFRQAVLVSIVFWIVAVVIALVVAALGSGPFQDYLTFVALILLGAALLVSSPLGNRVSAFEAKVWAGGSYRGEDRTEAGGLTALGLLLLLAPQIAIVSLLLG